jgi:hypothetical protein
MIGGDRPVSQKKSRNILTDAFVNRAMTLEGAD